MTIDASFFGGSSPGQRALLGISSVPDDAAVRRVGLLVCHAFSEERQMTYRSLYLFSQELARDGVPSLRFDYGGTGDSEGELADVTLDTMVNDTVCAAAEARRRLGVDKLVLLGIRLGAVVAAAAAGRIPGIEALVLWNPIGQGKPYLRDLLRKEKIIRMGSPVRQDERFSLRPGHVEFDGESLSPEMQDQLRALDLPTADLPTIPCLITGLATDKFEQEQVAQLARRFGALGIDPVCWTKEEREYWSSDSLYAEFHPVKTFDATLSFLRTIAG